MLHRRRTLGNSNFLLLLFVSFPLVVLSEADTFPRTKEQNNNETKLDDNEKYNGNLNLTTHDNYGFQKRQDGGFDLLNYFMHGISNQQPENQQKVISLGQLLSSQQQQPLQVQQQQNVQGLYGNHQGQGVAQPQIQHQQLQPQTQQLIHYQQQPQQLLQYNQLQQQPQQQLQYHHQQQHQRQIPQQVQYQQQVPHMNIESGRVNDGTQIQYENVAHLRDHNQLQQHINTDVSQRDGVYGASDYAGVDNTYAADPKTVGISVGIGSGKPVAGISIRNIITLLPKIFNVLSAGGKVMFGAELGKNFYFGPVGAKPL